MVRSVSGSAGDGDGGSQDDASGGGNSETGNAVVCGHICQKKTESGWEVVGDKHTAAQWLGTGSNPYPDCANQTLSPEEKAELIRIRSRKVWRMKTRVKQLIRKAKDK